jgi:hypothetical protein
MLNRAAYHLRIAPHWLGSLLRLSPARAECHQRMRAASATIETAYDLDSALMTLESWRVLKGSTQLMVKDIVFARV